ncbi:hypothetical protein [Roseomonas chloroacetimidivorans]|uniref:hypothetical protein n=1 Tax=Roseomonas chloroacetimidivorans TaxID=1766656 RepID=UPI003C74DB2E
MNAYTRPETAAPSSISPTSRDLREECAADRARIMLEMIGKDGHHSQIRDDILELLEELDVIEAKQAASCMQYDYDPGQDRIDCGRRVSMKLRSAKALIRSAKDEMEYRA